MEQSQSSEQQQQQSKSAASSRTSNPEQPSQLDPFALLISDHEQFRNWIGELQMMLSSQPDQSVLDRMLKLIDRLVINLNEHTSAEEQVLHEWYERKLGAQGKTFFDESLVYDQRDKNSLYQIEQWKSKMQREVGGQGGGSSAQTSSQDALTSRWRDLEIILRAFLPNITRHMELEENTYWSKLKPAMTADEQAGLCRALINAKSSAPTRTHPSAPDQPLAAKIVHPVTGALDREMDAVRGRQG